MKIAPITLAIAIPFLLNASLVYSKESAEYQIDTHICRDNEIISSSHSRISAPKKLYHAPIPELVFWYEVSPTSQKISIKVEYRRNRKGLVTWEKGPSFEAPFNQLINVTLLTENKVEIDWQILVRQIDTSNGMLGIENTNIRKKCI